MLRSYLGGINREELQQRLGTRLPFLASGLPELAERFPELGAAPQTDRFVVFSAAAGLISGEARERPLAIFLDDLHAADEPSLLALRFLADSVSEWPVLLVALARQAEGMADVAHLRLELDGLGADAVSALVEPTTGRAAQPTWSTRSTPRAAATRCSWPRWPGCSRRHPTASPPPGAT